MLISFNWLKELLNTEITVEEAGEILTGTGLEVEEINVFSNLGFIPPEVITAKIVSVERHPDAEKLNICKIETGQYGNFQVVCGAPNVSEGQITVFAPVNTVLNTISGEKLQINKVSIRGIESEGMLCASDEIGISNDHSGILILPPDTEIGKPLRHIWGEYSDHVLEIAITPNRGDAISHIGVVREIAAYKNISVCWPDSGVLKLPEHPDDFHAEIKCPELCYRYTGISLKNLKVQESPEWLKNRLLACGIKPINCVVDITNYVMLECGQPLHAFDSSSLEGKKIVVRLPQAGEIFKTLDEKEVKLSGKEVMICDAQKPVAIGGVMGGYNSMIRAESTEVFLESACFSPASIRQTASAHGYSTDASYRFERGTDPELTIYALKRAVLLLQQYAGAEISGNLIDLYPGKKPLIKVRLDFDFMRNFLGSDIDEAEIEDILQRLDYQIIEKEKEFVSVLVPSFRTDVSRPVDIIEDFLRIYGYDKIKFSQQFRSPLPHGKLESYNSFNDKLCNFLVSNGFYEILTPSFIPTSIVHTYYADKNDQLAKTINSVNVNFDTLRSDFLFSGLEALSFNIKRSYNNLRFFEFGRVYKKESQSTYKEEDKLAIWICGNLYNEHWGTPLQKADFYYLKAICNNILNLSGIEKYEYLKADNSDNLMAYLYEIKYDNLLIAKIGQVHPETTRKYDIKTEVYYAEFDSLLLKKIHESRTLKFRPMSKYPPVVRDLSLVMDEKVQYNDIVKTIEHLNITSLQQINLIDQFTGNPIGPGMKSYTIRIKFQDENKTMRDEEVEIIMKNILNSLEKNLKAQIRK